MKNKHITRINYLLIVKAGDLTTFVK